MAILPLPVATKQRDAHGTTPGMCRFDAALARSDQPIIAR